MNAELQQAARTAWAAMDDNRSKIQRIHDAMTGHRGPMLPEVALDFVQDVTGDRDEAFKALCAVGAESLTRLRPGERPHELHWSNQSDALMLEAALLGSIPLNQAHGLFERVEKRCRAAFEIADDTSERECIYYWGLWAEFAEAVLDRCDLIAAALRPEQVAA